MIFRIIICILLLLTVAHWIRFFVIHWKVKAYFWRTMPEDDKAVINYGGYRRTLFLNVLWVKKAKAFIRKRNEVLLKFDRERAERFIAAERKMCVAEFLFIILLWLVLVTFSVPRNPVRPVDDARDAGNREISIK